MAKLNIPDFERIRTMWKHYWAKDNDQRPIVVNEVSKNGFDSSEYYKNRYRYALTGDYGSALAQIDLILANTEYLGESIPSFPADHGPDQFAAFLGTDLEFSPESPETNWAKVVVEDWATFPEIKLHEDNRWFRSYIEYAKLLANHSNGRYTVAVADFHSNMDSLSALRGPQNLCMDVLMTPELILPAMDQVRKVYPQVYEKFYTAGNLKETGCFGWLPFYCEQRFATIQGDFICMVSPDIARSMIIPALEEEAAYLDHCVYHLDGPGALTHLDDLLAIKEIDAIQWGPGAGQKPQYEWMDVLKRCQKAGKGLYLNQIDSLDRVKFLCRELSHKGLLFNLDLLNRDETLRVIDWLDKEYPQV